MAKISRRKGRPKGSGIDDQTELEKIANLLSANPSQTRRHAIITACGLSKEDDSKIRRLNRKWKQHGARLLARTVASAADQNPTLIWAVLPEVMQNAPTFKIERAAQALRNSDNAGAFELSRALYHSPVMDAVRALHHSPVSEAARALHNSPMMEAVRAMHNSPVMQAMRALHESPTLQALHAAKAAY